MELLAFYACCLLLSPYLPPFMPPNLGDYKHFEVEDLCVDLLKDCQKRLSIHLFIYTYFYDDYHMPNKLT